MILFTKSSIWFQRGKKTHTSIGFDGIIILRSMSQLTSRTKFSTTARNFKWWRTSPAFVRKERCVKSTKWLGYEEPTWADARQMLADVPELMKKFRSEIRPVKLEKRFTKFLRVEWKSWTNLDVLIPMEESRLYFWWWGRFWLHGLKPEGRSIPARRVLSLCTESSTQTNQFL